MIWLLLVISTAEMYISVAGFMVSVAWLVISLGVLFPLCRANLPLQQLFHVFIVMIGYTGLLYWQQIAPVWFFLPLDMMMPILLSTLVFLLDRKEQRAYILLVGGMAFGQAFFQMTLWLYGLDNRIGGEAFLFSLSYSLLLTWLFRVGWSSFNALSNFVHRKLI